MMVDWSPMQPFRSRLDDVDEEIIKLFGERYKIRREVGAFKKANNLPKQDQIRVDEVIERAKQNAINYNVPTDFAEDLFKMVINYSHKFEEETE